MMPNKRAMMVVPWYVVRDIMHEKSEVGFMKTDNYGYLHEKLKTVLFGKEKNICDPMEQKHSHVAVLLYRAK